MKNTHVDLNATECLAVECIIAPRSVTIKNAVTVRLELIEFGPVHAVETPFNRLEWSESSVRTKFRHVNQYATNGSSVERQERITDAVRNVTMGRALHAISTPLWGVAVELRKELFHVKNISKL